MHYTIAMETINDFAVRIEEFVNDSNTKGYYYQFPKRVIDIIVSLILLIILSPVFLIISIIIKINSSGPVIFRQHRIGFKGKIFTIYKFRSLKVNYTNGNSKLNYQVSTKPEILVNSASDPRITSIGKFIRKTSIDEIPQLLNVLKGEMSLVGPRPLMPYQLLPNYKEFNEARILVKPGITGLWQISKRDQKNNINIMMPYDIDYIKKRSLILDFKILIQTLPAVMNVKGVF
jgi:exopolysaccharide production protein ExoY